MKRGADHGAARGRAGSAIWRRMMVVDKDALASGGRRLGAAWRGFHGRIPPGLVGRSLGAFLIVVGAVTVATLLTAGADYFIGDTTIYTFYMVAIIAIGFRYGTPFLLLAAVLSALAYAFYFADPPESFAVERPEVTYALLLLTVVAIATGRAARYMRVTHRDLRRTRDELIDQTRELTAALTRERDSRDALRNLVATMCHEFRTPLTTIDIIAQNERRAAARRGDEASRGSLESIRAEIRRVNELLTSLQDGVLHRGTMVKPPMSRVAVATLVADVCDLHRMAPANRTIVVSGEWPERPIPGNPQLLRQLFSNLVTNAVKYSSPSEPIAIEARGFESSIEIAVIDRGIGIPPDELPRVFEAYYRASNTGAVEGTGLGLALCREIVEAHRGRIGISANTPCGTRVTVRLPIDTIADAIG